MADHLRLPLRTRPWPGDVGWVPCPVCSRKWRPWAGSILPCHAQCLMTEEGKALLRKDANGSVTQRELAERYGITVPIVRALTTKYK